jgi:RNA polymerase sigma-70 factor (ECF subfamily)
MVQQKESQSLDASRFENFYIDDFTRLIRFVMTLGASVHDAEDVAQEAMKAAFIGWTTVTTPHAFVRRAAQRIFYRRCKQDRRRMESATASHTEAIAHDDADVDVRHLLRLVRSLPPRQREVMAWTIDGYGIAEVAAATGAPASTVRSHLRHARITLEKEIIRIRADASEVGGKAHYGT